MGAISFEKEKKSDRIERERSSVLQPIAFGLWFVLLAKWGKVGKIFLKSMPNQKAQTPEQGKLIGKVSHYFDKIEVAVIALDGGLKVGETIRIVGGVDTNFTQEVESMQVEHENVKKAKKGDEVGLKVKERVREGYKVYKL